MTQAPEARGGGAEPANPLGLAPRLRALFEQSFPRFSDAEYARRRNAIAHAMQHAGADHLLLVCAQGIGNAVRWVTAWPGTNEALLLLPPGKP